MRIPSRAGQMAAFLVAAVSAACSPTFNWREVPVGDAGLVVMLPCKPDRATRALPLGTASVDVEVVGCEAGGATFAVAHARAADAAQAEAWLIAWRAATRAQLADVQPTETQATLPRAALQPAPVRLDGRGKAQAHLLWFAQSRAGGVSLYQATVLGQPSSADAVTTFDEGLRLP
ncbi:hypothetical protein ACSFA2_13140 [Variovorax sp. LT2P21]|uniref:hypothetical protein n=1 Tax=Variovorax sp. LT2P21 TaxID=3443731 RepID=UPI003F4657EB